MAENLDTGSAVVAYGSTLEVQDPQNGIWLFVGGLTDFNGPQITRNEIDATTLASGAKEYVLDLKDNGTFTSTMQTRLGDPAQQLLVRGLDSANALNFRLTLPDDGFGNGQVVIAFRGRVQNFPISGANGQVISTQLSLRITGDVQFAFPQSGGAALSITPRQIASLAANNGVVTGIVNVYLQNAMFADPSSGVTFTGLPEGLSASVVRINDSALVISFTGAATNHEAGRAFHVGLAFADEVFSSASAGEIKGAVGQTFSLSFI